MHFLAAKFSSYDIDTLSYAILSAIGAGTYSLSKALSRISEFQGKIDVFSEHGKRQLKQLGKLVKMLEAAAEASSMVEGTSTIPSGVLTFLFAKN